MYKLHVVFVVLVIGLAAAACGNKKSESEGTGGGGGGGGGGGKVVASCDQRTMPGAPIKNCIEYVGKMWTKKEVQSRCTLEGQVFIDGACPTDGVVFTCVQERGKPMEANNHYYENLEKATKICESIGVPK